MSSLNRRIPRKKSSGRRHHQDTQNQPDTNFDPSVLSAAKNESSAENNPLLRQPQNLLGLQSMIGNQAVQRLLVDQPAPASKTGRTKQIQRTPVDWKNNDPIGSKEAVEDHQRYWERLRDVLHKAQNIKDPKNDNDLRLKNSARAMALIDGAELHVLSSLPPADPRNDENWLLDTPTSAHKANVYHKEPSNRENLTKITVGAAGQAIGVGIWIVFNDSITDAHIHATLMHEVQHMVDAHDVMEPVSITDKSWNTYSTEFRAYSLQGDFDYKGAQAGHEITGPSVSAEGSDDVTEKYVWDAQQFELFKYLYNAKAYAIKPKWDSEMGLDAGKRSFQKQVLNLKAPNSINPANSPDLHDFFEIFINSFNGPWRMAGKFDERFATLGKGDLENLKRVILNPAQTTIKNRLDNFLNSRSTTLDAFLEQIDTTLEKTGDQGWAEKAALSEGRFQKIKAERQAENEAKRLQDEKEAALQRKKEEAEQKRQQEEEEQKRAEQYMKDEKERLEQQIAAQQQFEKKEALRLEKEALDAQIEQRGLEREERQRQREQKEKDEQEEKQLKQAKQETEAKLKQDKLEQDKKDTLIKSNAATARMEFEKQQKFDTELLEIEIQKKQLERDRLQIESKKQSQLGAAEDLKPRLTREQRQRQRELKSEPGQEQKSHDVVENKEYTEKCREIEEEAKKQLEANVREKEELEVRLRKAHEEREAQGT